MGPLHKTQPLSETRTTTPVQTPQMKLMLRRFRPPVRAQVWRSPQGKPVRILSSKTEGRVAACAGPWLISGGWWERDPWDHAQWDIEMASGGLFRIHCNVLTGMWGIDGSYD
jgi:hypothetical protein